MTRYIYDGSFDGLLTSIYQAYYQKDDIYDIVFEDSQEQNFLFRSTFIVTEEEKAKRVYEAIKMKISKKALKLIFYAYLSEIPGHGIAILEYVRLGFKLGPRVDLHLSNDIVIKINNISNKVAKERHRMTGLARFEELENGIFYCAIEPDYNIVGLLAPHFASRMSNENWIIHDVSRGIKILYNKQEWIVTDIEIKDHLIVKQGEEAYQDLWRTYFKSIAIENKINPKLQKKNMPRRYWKYLVEFF
ncbi:MAG: DNA metabolism protein [Tissierellia bacterium]|nr:DNA metabolism protein [Tissierellia bacterium]